MYFWKKFFTAASGNQFFPFFRYSWQLKLFSDQSKFILITNCWNWFSGQSKLFYHNFSNILSTGSSFSISSKYVLNESLTTVSCNGFLFKWNDILSFIFSFFETTMPLEGDEYLKKSYSCSWKLSSLTFWDTDSNGSSLLVHWDRIFQRILHSG